MFIQDGFSDDACIGELSECSAHGRLTNSYDDRDFCLALTGFREFENEGFSGSGDAFVFRGVYALVSLEISIQHDWEALRARARPAHVSARG